ncbi:MAG TPA: carbamoyltransferase C-terminal domain-containing protein [Aldersonia sp.]
MAILGVYEGHNAGAALISDANGSVVAVVEEERFSRVKNHDARPGAGPGPIQSIRWCLATAAKIGESITALAIGLLDPDVLQRRAVNSFARALADGETQRLTRADELNIDAHTLLTMPSRSQTERLTNVLATLKQADFDPGSVPQTFVEHHLCHAAAFLLAPVNRALVVTLDGKGDDLSGSVCLGHDHQIQQLRRIPAEHSLGHFYSAATVACGLRPQRDEGKLMAMAAAGNANAELRAELDRLVRFDPETGTPLSRLNHGIVQGPYPDRVASFHNRRFADLIRDLPRADVARTVQEILESIVADVVQHHLNRTGESAVVVSGGVFANVALNRKLGTIRKLREFHVHPGMTDSGIALGAAAWTYARNHRRKPEPLGRLDLGPDYSDDNAVNTFEHYGYVLSSAGTSPETQLAAALAAGHVVARFVGGCEYGPRALGFRSVLAPATSPDQLRTLNNRLARSHVMPFAPVVLTEWADLLFEDIESVRIPLGFMTTAVMCTELARKTIPGAVHSDGTARPQLVDGNVDGSLASLLDAYHRRTGIMGLVNTSFNLHDEPIVCSPTDAARTATVAQIDVVQVGGRVCLRNENAQEYVRP